MRLIPSRTCGVPPGKRGEHFLYINLLPNFRFPNKIGQKNQPHSSNKNFTLRDVVFPRLPPGAAWWVSPSRYRRASAESSEGSSNLTRAKVWERRDAKGSILPWGRFQTLHDVKPKLGWIISMIFWIVFTLWKTRRFFMDKQKLLHNFVKKRYLDVSWAYTSSRTRRWRLVVVSLHTYLSIYASTSLAGYPSLYLTLYLSINQSYLPYLSLCLCVSLETSSQLPKMCFAPQRRALQEASRQVTLCLPPCRQST